MRRRIREAFGTNRILRFLIAVVSPTFIVVRFTHPTKLLWLNFATVYLHFIMDRAVFRFSNPEVRKVTGALLFARTFGTRERLQP